jgi:hypothetical protein
MEKLAVARAALLAVAASLGAVRYVMVGRPPSYHGNAPVLFLSPRGLEQCVAERRALRPGINTCLSCRPGG